MRGDASSGCMRAVLTLTFLQSSYLWTASRGYETAYYVDPRHPGDVPYRLKGAHGAKMGIINPECDNAKLRLEVDYNGSPLEYTCTRRDLLRYMAIGGWYPSKRSCDKVDKNYHPYHYCMNKRITYSDAIPTHEGHRPLWPVYGEYTYVPPQRWLHNIEHGAVVMLYHPCAPTWFVQKLRTIVTSCIRKHIITPYRHLHLTRPLALVAWGCRLEMSHVNTREVVKFIQRQAKRGPEGTLSAEGQYQYMLLKRAEAPRGSDMDDTNLCPIGYPLNTLDE